jgi:hypothetical protein
MKVSEYLADHCSKIAPLCGRSEESVMEWIMDNDVSVDDVRRHEAVAARIRADRSAAVWIA